MHESVRGDDLAAARHHTFILSHLVGAALAALVIPVHWALNGSLDPVVLVALAWMMMPALVAVFLSRTGALGAAYLLSSAILAGLVGWVAVHTGGLTSFALFWLLVVPVEAALSTSRKVVVAAIALCVGVLAGLAAASALDFLPPSRIATENISFYGAAGLISALVYIGILAVTIEHLHGKTDEAAHDNARRFQLLAENATDVITRHDPNGNVSFISGAADKLVDCAPELLSRRGYMNLVHPEDRHVYLTAFVRAADTGEPAHAEFRLANNFADADSAPTYKWVELSCRPIKDGNEETRQIVAISRDITARRRQQEELRAARDTAEQANNAKTSFLANISHELRTPLNSVIGFAEILERELPDQAKMTAAHGEYATLIRQSGEHLLAVVNDLLDLSKIEAGQFRLCPETVDLNEVAAHCLHTLQPEADAAGKFISTQFAEGGIDVLADQRACKQILLNLLSNAIKFSDEGGTILVKTLSDGQYARIVVQDHGRGIAPDVVAKLGQPFVQADAAYSRTHEGAGLGLSIVSGLVKLHQGRMQIDSRLGEGTTVTISLPVSPALEEEADVDDIFAADEKVMQPTV